MNLTLREREIIELICEGYSTSEIASALFISENTVKTHRKQMITKFEARNGFHLIKKYYDNIINNRSSDSGIDRISGFGEP